MPTILIVDDEPAINALIEKNLRLVGHACQSAYDGHSAAQMMQEQRYDLILLDIMLPGLDGYALIEKAQGTPVIFLTAKAELADRVKGLTLGADDYIVKPFEMVELIARVDAVLRRTYKQYRIFQAGSISIDFDSRTVQKDQVPVECTPQEFALLEILVINRNLALSREKLLELAWGYNYEGDTRTVDVHIQRLRKKLGWDTHIKTVYKLGYRLEV